MGFKTELNAQRSTRTSALFLSARRRTRPQWLTVHAVSKQSLGFLLKNNNKLKNLVFRRVRARRRCISGRVYKFARKPRLKEFRFHYRPVPRFASNAVAILKVRLYARKQRKNIRRKLLYFKKRRQPTALKRTSVHCARLSAPLAVVTSRVSSGCLRASTRSSRRVSNFGIHTDLVQPVFSDELQRLLFFPVTGIYRRRIH